MEVIANEIVNAQLCCYECIHWGNSYLKLHGNLRLCKKYNRITGSEENCRAVAALEEAKGTVE